MPDRGPMGAASLRVVVRQTYTTAIELVDVEPSFALCLHDADEQ
jgi:hypothetical protein